MYFTPNLNLVLPIPMGVAGLFPEGHNSHYLDYHPNAMDLEYGLATDVDSADLASILDDGGEISRQSSAASVTSEVTDFEKTDNTLDLPHIPHCTLGLSEPSNGLKLPNWG